MRNSVRSLLIISCIGFISIGCSEEQRGEKGAGKPEKEKSTTKTVKETIKGTKAELEGNVLEARAKVAPTEGNKVKGEVFFTALPEGIRIVADFEGLTPGEHGFHVHDKGDCSAHDASSAGGHFNPTNTKHGGPDSSERHVGDLGNVVADGEGRAHYERTDKVITLNGENSIVGRSIVIHADKDDFTTQPTGNSGARVGCGIIEAVK